MSKLLSINNGIQVSEMKPVYMKVPQCFYGIFQNVSLMQMWYLNFVFVLSKVYVCTTDIFECLFMINISR